MIRESLFLRTFIAIIIWIGAWVIAGIGIAMLLTLVFFDQGITDFFNLNTDVSKLLPQFLTEGNMSEDMLLEASKELFNDSRASNKQNVTLFIQAISSFIGFVGASWLIVKIYRDKVSNFFQTKKPSKLSAWILVPLIFIAFIPFIGFTGAVNSTMKLPGFMETIELWMRETEFKTGVLTMFIASGDSILDLILTVMVLALIPALGEELFFRGILQKNFIDFHINPHTAIFITAIIFSAIHMQFFGFFPRFFLGVILGYIYYWSNNIVLAILGHFTWNSLSVIMIYYMNNSQNLENVEELSSTPGALFAVISLLVASGLAYLFSKQFSNQ